MTDVRNVRVQRFLRHVETGWVRARTGVAPYARRLVAAVRTAWSWLVATIAPRARQLAAGFTTGLERLRPWIAQQRRRHRRPRAAAELGARMSHLAKQAAAQDVEDGECVSLGDLLGHVEDDGRASTENRTRISLRS